MSDETIQLPSVPAAESIPPALAAPKRVRKAPPAPLPVAAAPAPEPRVARVPAVEATAIETPTAAAPAESQQETETVATTAETVQNTAQNMGQNVADKMKDAGETAGRQAQAFLAEAKDRTEAAVAKGQRFWAEMAEFNKGNVEALVESGRIAAKGFEQLGREAAEEARRSMEAAQAAMKTLAEVRSPTEFVRLQGEFTRTAFDQAVARTSRGTETMLKLAGEIAQPISNRMALAADKMKAAA